MVPGRFKVPWWVGTRHYSVVLFSSLSNFASTRVILLLPTKPLFALATMTGIVTRKPVLVYAFFGIG